MNNFVYNFSGFDTYKVLEYGLDDSDLHILSYLYAVQFSDNMDTIKVDNNVYCFLRYEKIVEDNPTLYMKRRNLEIRMAKLKKVNLVETIVKCQEGSCNKRTYFRITDKARMMMFHQSTIIKNIEEATPEVFTVVEEENSEIVEQWELDFQKFYKAYPKKQDKQNVIKWFRKNKPSEKLMDQIMFALEKFKKTKQWQENKGQFIPMPSTWLNNKRWEDEIVAGKSELEQFLENNSGIDEVF